MLNETEDKVALGLVLVGYAGLVIHGIATMGTSQAILIFIVFSILTVLSVVAGTLAAFITAAIMQTSFGVFQSAVLRLAGTMVLTTAMSVMLPFGGLLSFIAFFALLAWFFDLDGMEMLVFSIVLWAMRYVVMIVLAILIGMAFAAV